MKLRKWFKDREKIRNGDVEIYYDSIEYRKDEVILYIEDRIVARLGSKEEVLIEGE